MDRPIYIAITRRVRAGCEAEFQEALREFFQASFAHSGVLGANMITPPPGSTSREFGILRTFRSEEERDAFYESPMFKAWEHRVGALVEGESVRRQLHGLEAWFRSASNPPPRWKMAVVTLIGVYPISLSIGILLSPWLQPLPLWLNSFIVSALMVTCLTWFVMPLLTRVFKPLLDLPSQRKKGTA